VLSTEVEAGKSFSHRLSLDSRAARFHHCFKGLTHLEKTWMVAAGLAVAMATATARWAADFNDWLIVAGKGVGPITARTTRADLIRIFGASNVEDGEIIGSDGGREAGTIVFGTEPEKSLGILWLDDTAEAHIRSIVFCHGSEHAEKCRWHTREPISFGTDLKTLERLNGHKFKLNGFDWGYGGLITSWEGGHLERLSTPCGRLTLRVDPTPGLPTDKRSELIERLEENDEFWSSDASMEAMNPAVDHMSMSFQACNK
jgi:hypothetical protein